MLFKCPHCGEDVADLTPEAWGVCGSCKRPIQAPPDVKAFSLELDETTLQESRRRLNRGPAMALPPYRVSSRCPMCGCPEFESTRPKTFVAFTSDRVCCNCQTRYTPPTPVWASIVFLLIGIVFVLGCTFSVLLGIMGGAMTAVLVNGLFAICGLLLVSYGVRCLRLRPTEAPEWPRAPDQLESSEP
jgi:hypothetical protein